MPIGPRCSRKSFERTAVYLGSNCRIVEYCPLGPNRGCQRTEERKVVLAAKENDFLVCLIRQHAKIVVTFGSVATLVRLGTRAECDVVVWRQKVRP